MHPHRKEAHRSHAQKASHLSGGELTAGAGSGPGRLQKIALQRSHPILDEGGEPSNYTDLGPSAAPEDTTPMVEE